MSDERLVVHARVRCVLEVRLVQPWSGEETADVIMKRARVEATEIVQQALSGKASFVSQPKVYMIIADKEDGAP